MSSKRTVLFLANRVCLLEGFRETKNHIRGRVINDHLDWDLYIVKHDKLCWVVYKARNRDECTRANKIAEFNPRDSKWVRVPERVFGDCHTIINWAHARKGP